MDWLLCKKKYFLSQLVAVSAVVTSLFTGCPKVWLDGGIAG
jgi:hypothetical protein